MSAAERVRVEIIVDWLIYLLDCDDGDPDREPDDNGIADLDSILLVEAYRFRCRADFLTYERVRAQ